nr:alpha/beta hydrolase [Kibdelosporangium sp. MJ126-NF4]
MVGLSDELGDTANTGRWHGQAAAAATENLSGIRDGLEDLVSEIAAMRTAMGQVADSVTGLRHGIADAEALASRYYLRIEDNGALTGTTEFGFSSEDERKQWEQDRERVKAELAERVKEIIRRAEDIDNDLSTVMSKCLDPGGTGNRNQDSLTEAARAGADAGTLSMLEPPVGGTAASNAAWWATLGEGGKQWILASHPEWIGNLDGVPAHYRDLANRARIPGERARLRAERDAKAAELRAYEDTPPMSVDPADQRLGRLRTELAAIDAKLDSLRDVENMLTQPERQLLVLDTTGERAKAAIAVGNVDTANHVAVFTPGMNSTVNDRMEGYDQDVEDLRRNALEELRRNGRAGETVATVTWLNYEPPSFDLNPGDAASDSKAREGAARLSSFLNGIDASRTDDPHLTAIGHSYGSLTTGIALRDNDTGVDDVAVFGSPGLGVNDAAQLKAPTGHIYNMEADGDRVADAADITKGVSPSQQGWYGRDPAEMPGMRQLSTHDYTAPDGRHFIAAHGHSEYLRSGDEKYTTSEWNLANVVAGTGITH